MDQLPLYQVDAFTDKLFKGNPAAVCPLEAWLPDSLMQDIAAENNLAETAFFVKTGDQFELRWFTPLVEVDLCGHATLAAAHVLYEHLDYDAASIAFQSKNSGLLTVSKNNGALILDFPADELAPCPAPGLLQESLGVEILECAKGKTDYLVRVEDQDALDSISPDFRTLSTLPVRGVIVTCPGETYDFASRFFAPASGVDEDPVTGSAHTTLVPYWANETGKTVFTAQQRSKREGILQCRLEADRVKISGKARTYLAGHIHIETQHDE